MSEKMDFVAIILNSGIVLQLVLVLLIACSIITWAIFIKKRKEIKAITAENNKFDEIYYSSSSLREIYNSAKHVDFAPNSTLFSLGYEELMKVSEKFSEEKPGGSLESHFSTKGLLVIERALNKGVNISNEKLEKNLTWLATIGSIAPYIGLFGTVWGIISSFHGLSSGGGSLESVAPGIAEALIATAIGLAAAIPSVLFFNYFNNEIGRWQGRMDSFKYEFLNLVERSLIKK